MLPLGVFFYDRLRVLREIRAGTGPVRACDSSRTFPEDHRSLVYLFLSSG